MYSNYSQRGRSGQLRSVLSLFCQVSGRASQTMGHCNLGKTQHQHPITTLWKKITLIGFSCFPNCHRVIKGETMRCHCLAFLVALAIIINCAVSGLAVPCGNNLFPFLLYPLKLGMAVPPPPSNLNETTIPHLDTAGRPPPCSTNTSMTNHPFCKAQECPERMQPLHW